MEAGEIVMETQQGPTTALESQREELASERHEAMAAAQTLPPEANEDTGGGLKRTRQNTPGRPRSGHRPRG